MQYSRGPVATRGTLCLTLFNMSKYEALDARTELEQVVCSDLRLALEKRGWNVVHNGHQTSHAPANTSDIVASNKNTIITFEVTKAKGASQDRELLSISHHLKNIKDKAKNKKCYCVFVSPETAPRILNGIRDHNQQRFSEGTPDLKILPLSFDNFALWVTRLSDNVKDLYPVADFLKLFQHYPEFVDDLRILKLLNQHLFPDDSVLAARIEREEMERDQKAYEAFLRDLTRMENFMRENGVATGSTAIDNLIYLVFLKLYGEKREREGQIDHLRSTEAFETYRSSFAKASNRKSKRAIHQLFESIKEEEEFVTSGMFTEGSHLEDSVDDDFITDYVIPIFSKYTFLGTRIDALGALYETLALRASKDIKVGQFFTPENVVHFMVKMAELDYADVILDPACGTGRFLIYAMADMLEKLKKSNVRNKEHERNQICLHRLFGADIDQRIAKIAKMNMWIHGDGKSNIFGGREYNGLTLHKHSFDGHRSFDNAFDVVLTNPPLGELNYQSIPFTDAEDDQSPEAELRTLLEKFRRMPILPRKNVTEEQMKTVRARLETYRRELAEIETRIVESEKEDSASGLLSGYKKFSSSAQSKRRTVEQNELLVAELEARLRSGREDQIQWEITGNTMKGGAMFLAAIWHYLKDLSYPAALPEWRGGKALVILDEGILNTNNYKDARDFIRSHYYIKAVVSLTRDTFVPVSKTTTKTSIIYLIKKTDLNAVQQEPIFYGHVEKVGLDTKKKRAPNDLDTILAKYLSFKSRVLESYVGPVFSRERFLAQYEEGTSQ